jgi:hypothetical protein
MSSVGASLSLIQNATTRYAFPILLALGALGNLFCIVIFLQKHQRRSSCSSYLIAAAVFSTIGISSGVGTYTYVSYQSIDPFTVSSALCRIRGYTTQTFSILYRSMVLLTCADRFACTSTRPIMRSFCRPKIALKISDAVTIFWMVASIHLPIFQTIRNNQCTIFGSYGLFFSIYQICLIGLIFPILMSVLGFLIFQNLKEVRARVQPIQGNNNVQQNALRNRDLDFIKLTLAEVSCVFALNFLYPINLFYNMLTSNISDKSLNRIQIEAFVDFVSRTVLFHFSSCLPFYLYLITSKSFRLEVKRVILKVWKILVQGRTNAGLPTIA